MLNSLNNHWPCSFVRSSSLCNESDEHSAGAGHNGAIFQKEIRTDNSLGPLFV